MDAGAFFHLHVLDASRELVRQTFDQCQAESFFWRQLHPNSIIRDCDAGLRLHSSQHQM